MLKQITTVTALTTAIATLVLAGCTTTDQQGVDMTDEQRVEQTANQQRVNRLPDWVTAPVETSVNHLETVKSGTGSGPVKAINEARTLARFDLAKQFHAQITGQIRMVVNNSGYSSNTEGQNLIDSFVDEVRLRGTETEEQAVFATPNGFEAYVMMEMSGDAIDQTIVDNRDALGEDLFQKLMDRRQGSGESTSTGGTSGGSADAGTSSTSDAASDNTATATDLQEAAQEQPDNSGIADAAADARSDVSRAINGGGE
mgnify:CR=1 FL=1